MSELMAMVIHYLNALLICEIIFVTVSCCPSLLQHSQMKLINCIFLIIVMIEHNVVVHCLP